MDLSSASDSENDSEDSDGLSGFRCQNCLVTGEWQLRSNEGMKAEINGDNV